MIRPNFVCTNWKSAYLTLTDGDRVILYFKDFIPDANCPLAIKIDYHGDNPMNSSIATLPLAVVPRDAVDYYPLGYVAEEEYSYEEPLGALYNLLEKAPQWKVMVKNDEGKVLWETTRYDDTEGADDELHWLIGRLSQTYPDSPTIEKYWAPVRTGTSIEILLPDGDTQVYNMKGEHLFIRTKESPSATEPEEDKADKVRRHYETARGEYCECSICTLGPDEYIRNFLPGEY